MVTQLTLKPRRQNAGSGVIIPFAQRECNELEIYQNKKCYSCLGCQQDQEKVQQEKLKAVKARLNFEEASHQSESGTPVRRSSDQIMPAAGLEVLNQSMAAPSHLGKRVRKGKRCSKGWREVCSRGSETRVKVYSCTQTTQGVGHTTVAAETLKVATKVLVQEQQSSPPRDVITREHP
ncbi:hypothetical protein Tco_0047743 [Tanacetum coccineum]